MSAELGHEVGHRLIESVGGPPSPVAALGERTGQVRPDEAGPAGHHHSHAMLPLDSEMTFERLAAEQLGGRRQMLDASFLDQVGAIRDGQREPVVLGQIVSRDIAMTIRGNEKLGRLGS